MDAQLNLSKNKTPDQKTKILAMLAKAYEKQPTKQVLNKDPLF